MIGDLESMRACAAALASRNVSSAELVQRSLDRIAALDGPSGGGEARQPTPGGLNAVITQAPDALAAAHAADARRAQGREFGPFDGVPITVKDCIETAGLRTTHGSAAFADWVPGRNAPVVARLLGAGMVVVAKVSLDDFATSCFGLCSLQGWIRNPHDRRRTVGGSSGGSAVAVAAGYSPLSLGTDTGGSLRIPAALCGVATLRPTVGAISTAGVFARAPSQDTVGPMAHTVADLACAYGLLTGARHDFDPAPPAIREVTFGVVREGLAISGDDPEGPVGQRFDELAAQLRGAGAHLVPLAAPPRHLLDASELTSIEAHAAADDYLATAGTPVTSFVELVATGAFQYYTGRILESELEAPEPSRSVAAYRAREELRAWTAAQWAEHQLDAVLYPSVQRVAGPLGEQQEGCFTRWSENTGMPAVCVPMGLVSAPDSAGPLPCGVEVLGLPGSDCGLLGIAALLERVLSPNK